MDKAATLTNANDYVSLSGGLNVTGTVPNPLFVNQDSTVNFTVSALGAGTFTGVSVQPYLKTPNGTWTPIACIDKQLSTNLSGAAAIAVPDNTIKSYSVKFSAGMFIDAKLVLTAISTGPIVAEITTGKIIAGGEVIVVPTAASATTFGAGITLNGATGTNTITIPTAEAVAASISDGTNTYMSINSTTGNLTLGAAGKTQNVNGLLAESATNSITANPGGGQGSAVALTTKVNRVTTVATAGDSVKLPASAAGLDIVVINSSTNPLAVFPATGDTINGGSANASVTQMPNSVCFYCCAVAGGWSVEGIGTGFAGSLPTLSFTNSITANAGGGQAGAIALTSASNRVATVATQGDSVKLPASVAGLAITIDNHGANACQVFGAGTDTINGIATATGISHGVNQIATYYCFVAGNWEVQFSQAQQPGIVSLTGTADAIPPHVAHTYVVNKAGVDAMTLAAPTATTDDGLVIVVTSNTANAHTITATGLLQCGTASVNVATFAAQKGASLTLMAYQGKWNVISSNAITFS